MGYQLIIYTTVWGLTLGSLCKGCGKDPRRGLRKKIEDAPEEGACGSGKRGNYKYSNLPLGGLSRTCW